MPSTTVEQVGNAQTEHVRLRKEKNKDAEWVMGLEDEATLAEYFKKSEKLRRKMMRRQAKRVARGLGGPEGACEPDVDVSSDGDSADDENFEVLGGAGGFYAKDKNTTRKTSKKRKGKKESVFMGALKEYTGELSNSIRRLATAWLRTPLIFLSLATAILLFQHVSYFEIAQTFNHPPTEVSLWDYCRTRSWIGLLTGVGADAGTSPSTSAAYQTIHAATSHFPPITLFHLLASLAAITLAFKLGGAAQNFIALCGVGCGVLALIATVLDVWLAANACPTEGYPKPCDYPFGSHWALSCIKNIGATAGVSMAAHVFDLVVPSRKGAGDEGSKDIVNNKISSPTAAAAKTSSPRLGTSTIVTAIPVILHVAFYLASFLLEGGINRNHNSYVVEAGAGKSATGGMKGALPSSSQSSIQASLAYYASLTQLVAWGLLIPTVSSQKRLITEPASAQ